MDKDKESNVPVSVEDAGAIAKKEYEDCTRASKYKLNIRCTRGKRWLNG